MENVNQIRRANIPTNKWVRNIIGHIHSQHFREIKQFRNQRYFLFRAKLLLLFEHVGSQRITKRELLRVKLPTRSKSCFPSFVSLRPLGDQNLTGSLETKVKNLCSLAQNMKSHLLAFPDQSEQPHKCNRDKIPKN